MIILFNSTISTGRILNMAEVRDMMKSGVALRKLMVDAAKEKKIAD